MDDGTSCLNLTGAQEAPPLSHLRPDGKGWGLGGLALGPCKEPFPRQERHFSGAQGKGGMVLALLLMREEGLFCAPIGLEGHQLYNECGRKHFTLSPEGAVGISSRTVLPNKFPNILWGTVPAQLLAARVLDCHRLFSGKRPDQSSFLS